MANQADLRPEKQFTKTRQMAIQLVCFPNDYYYLGRFYIGIASFQSQCYNLVKFRERNICSCHRGVFKQQGHLIFVHTTYFANWYKAF